MCYLSNCRRSSFRRTSFFSKVGLWEIFGGHYVKTAGNPPQSSFKKEEVLRQKPRFIANLNFGTPLEFAMLWAWGTMLSNPAASLRPPRLRRQ